MRTKNILFTLIASSLLMGGVGCEKNAGSKIPPDLLKTWKLEGFLDVGTGILKPVEPVGDQFYILTFQKDNTLDGYTSTNEIFGEYTVDMGKEMLKISNLWGTEINELFDGPRYVETLSKVEFYSLSKDKLRLFYDTDYCLQFKSQ